MEKVTRPEGDIKKIHCSNEFELCYLRHKYLRRTEYNPSPEEMRPYHTIIRKVASYNHFLYKSLFDAVGFGLEDLISIGKIHLVSFLGLFSLERVEKKYEDFIELYTKKNKFPPSDTNIRDKNKANFTIFLKQRMEDVVRICRQKVRNIRGLPIDEYYVFCGTKKPPQDKHELLENHESYGYRKVDHRVFKSIKRKARRKNNNPFKFNRMWYVCVDLDKRVLSLSDFQNAGLDPYDSIHNKTPEQICLDRQKEEIFERNKEKFYGQTLQDQATMIEEFISKNRKDDSYRDEIETATRYLKKIEKKQMALSVEK